MAKSIVIVEDDENIAAAEKLILQEVFDVFVATDGEAGLALIEEKKPDVALLDVMLPKMNGFDICKRLRSNGDLQSLKIVIVTAKNEERDEAEGMDLGADDYIMKPFEPDELLHVVNQVLKY